MATKYSLYNGYLYRKAGDLDDLLVTGDSQEGLVYPVYDSEEDRDREQIENLFVLGGGELEEEPWANHAYWYEGIPEHDETLQTDDDYEYRTVISWSHTAPKTGSTITDEDGVVWEAVDWYHPPTEADCWVCGAGSDAFVKGFREVYDRDPQPGDECGLCSYKFEDMPGYVYDSEAHEVVYRTHNKNLYPEIYGD